MSSRKMLRFIIGMAVLLVLVVTVYLLVDSSKKKEEDAAQAELDSLQLFSFNSDNVNLITFETDEGNFRIEFVSGEWTLTETDYPYDLDLNPYYINSVCAYMCDLKASSKISVTPDRLDAYGLTEPTVLTCYEGSTPHTLYVGGPSATQECYYAMLPGDDTVYSISYESGRLLEGTTFYLRSHDLIPFHETKVTAYSIERSGLPDLVLHMKDDAMWYMDEPLKGGNINSATVKSMLTNVTRIEVDGFVTAEKGVDLSPYGLDHPDYTLTVGAEDEKDCVLLFAYAPEDNSKLYVLNKDTGLISVLSVSSAGFLNTAPEELMNDTLLSLNFQDASGVEAQVDDLTFTMTMDHEAGAYQLNDTDVAALGSSAVSTFKNLFDTMAKITYESLDPDADIPEDAEPACRFAFTLKNGSETELTLIQSGDENIYWALVDGSYTGCTIRRRSLTSNTGVLNFYERMTDLIDANA